MKFNATKTRIVHGGDQSSDIPPAVAAIMLVLILLLAGCAQLTLQDAKTGHTIARIQGNAASVHYTGNGVELTVVTLDNATATSAIWHGATRFTGALALAAAPFAPSITPAVAALPTIANGAGLFVTPPKPAATLAH